MFIKNLLRRVAEKLTGKKCSRYKYNRGGYCTHPDGSMFMRCWHSVTRPGFTGKYEKTAHAPELTPEEEYQLGKIKTALEEAGEIARESGLVED